MQAFRTLPNSWQGSASRRKPLLWAGLLLSGLISPVSPTFAEQRPDSNLDTAVASALPDHWQELTATDLDDIHGRYVPATELDLNTSWSVILWDEGKAGHTGNGNGSGSHQTQHGSNQQRQSFSTTTVR